MGNAFLHGNVGGTYLNFMVKTYPSETELKEDKPYENTIGVITTTTMRSWVFSATEPTEPEVGMVWICIGTSSPVEFNSLKKNAIQVYPIFAKQYVGGKFEEVTAMTFDGEQWKSWVTYLYNAGDECSDITGGWGVAGYTDIDTENTTLEGTKNSDHLLVWYVTSGGNYYLYGFGTANTVSFADKSELVIDAERVSGGNATVYVNDSKNFYNQNHEATVALADNGKSKIDISTLNRSYYIYIRPDAYSESPPKWKIKSISLH